jgi:hypothetical protein
MKLIIAVLLGIVWFASPVRALTCRSSNHHDICIVNIKRSAKNYWEYRASVRIDGVTKPVQIYDCRTRKTITNNPILEDFEQDGTAQFVCSFFKEPRDAFGMASGKPTSFGINFDQDRTPKLKSP